jgi:hypothetical protein
MKTATSLALVAIGAIFAFAITRSPSFLNLQVVGWVLMLTGAAGAIIPRRGYGWLRRRIVVSTDETAQADAGGAPAAPAATPARQRKPQQKFSRILVPGGINSPRYGRPQPTEGQVEHETIEEYVEE